MPVIIHESGLNFGPYAEDDLFQIENWVRHHELDSKGISSVEFILHLHRQDKSPQIMLVEAKSSIPKDTKTFFADIQRKFTDSLSLWVGLLHQRFSVGTESLGGRLATAEAFTLPINLILVIPDMPDEYVQPANDAFRQFMKRTRVLWGLEYTSATVLNERLARTQGL